MFPVAVEKIGGDYGAALGEAEDTVVGFSRGEDLVEPDVAFSNVGDGGS